MTTANSRAEPESFCYGACGAASAAEVENEWDAQIQKSRCGIAPKHLDGHKHVHMLPGLFEIACGLRSGTASGAFEFAGSVEPAQSSFLRSNGRRRGMKQASRRADWKLLARDAREQAAHAGIAAPIICGLRKPES